MQSPDLKAEMQGDEPRLVTFLIRELVALGSFKPDAQWIGKKLYPPLSRPTIQKALQTLETSKMIEYSRTKGRYVQVTRDLKTSEVVAGAGILDHHNEMLALGSASIRYANEDLRDLGVMTVAVTDQCAARIKGLVVETLTKIFDLSGKESNPDALYQLGTQVFPLTAIKSSPLPQ
jgi:uncharacterized protein (TIGR02147 family)